MTQTWAFLTNHDTSQLRLLPGLRNAFGVVLSIVVGLWTGNLVAGLAVAIGAQVAGFAGLNGTARRRFRTMSFAAFWMAMTTLLGGMSGGTWWAVGLITVLGFIAGLLVSVSNEAGLVGLWATIALIFISGFHQTQQSAVYHALYVFVGGMLQALLMIIVDWVRQSNAETSAVAEVFLAISSYAKTGTRKVDLRVAAALLEADAGLSDSFVNQSRWKELRTLLDLAESVRIEVVALNGILKSLRDEDPKTKIYREDLYKARGHIAELLAAMAESLQTRSRLAQNWQDSLEALNRCSQRGNEQLTPRDWLHGYACTKHAYVELLKMSRLLHQDKRTLGLSLHETWLRSPMPQVQRAFEAIRANFTFRSATFRHAVRLGVALGIATLIYQFLPFSRGYWFPLTTLVILKPEFTTTISRGVARVLGTLLGSVFATVLLEIPDPTHLLGVLLIGVFLTGMYTVLNYNMVLFSGILTAEVVVLLSFFQRTPLLMTIEDRVIYTVAGSLLAFIAYVVWPTWQHKNIPDAMTNLISAERQYLNAIFSMKDFSLAESYRKRTRLARTNVVNLVNQAMTEPVSGAWDEHAIHGLLTTLHRFSDTLLSLEAYLAHEQASFHGHGDIMEFGEYVSRCLLEIESDVHRSRDVRQSTTSRPQEIQLAEGTLDEVSPFTKQQLLELDIPASLTAILIRMEDNLSTMFRVVAALSKAEPGKS